MSKVAMTAATLALGISSFVVTPANAAIYSPASMEGIRAVSIATATIEPVRMGARVGRHHAHSHGRTIAAGHRGVATGRAVAAVRPVRPWVRRPYYGRIIAGVTLGTVIAATAVAVAPPAPASNLCWYWSDSSQTQGYWDYCR